MAFNALPAVELDDGESATFGALKVVAIIPDGIFATLDVCSPPGEQISVNGGAVLGRPGQVEAGMGAVPVVGGSEVAHPLFGYSQERLKLLGGVEAT
jgi:hypothetical protein